MSFYTQALIYLTGMVVAVPLAKRLGLGSVLGYLAAGMVLGPSGFGVAEDVEAVLQFSELGVVFLLFILGLELQPARLWSMRRLVFGLGGAQVGLTALAMVSLALLVGMPRVEAVLVGVGLSLSSTAFALQLLGERNQLATSFGRAAFGILLFQDLAVIVLLALLPALTGDSVDPSRPLWLSLARGALVLGGVIASKWLLRPMLKLVASQHNSELFTAASLLVVVGISEAVAASGLSTALGAFLAGVLFADSRYRHALEADIEPFKGLLLGLFFMAVGMSVNFSSVALEPGLTALLVTGILSIKVVILFGLGRRHLPNTNAAWHLALAICQGGEFAFVIFGQAVRAGAMSQRLSDLLIAAVALSMAATPLMYAAYERLLMPRLTPRPNNRAYDVAPQEDTPVIIAGFGRVGQVIGHILHGLDVAFTALDSNADHIDFIKQTGGKVFYGDASRVDLLRAARADAARVFVIAISDPTLSLRSAATIKANFPHLTVVARAHDRSHALALLDLGVEHVIRETMAGSLAMTSEILTHIGLTFFDAQAAIDRFSEHDESLLAAGVKAPRLAGPGAEELEVLMEVHGQEAATAQSPQATALTREEPPNA